MKDRTQDEAMAELFRENPAVATQYLDNVLEEGDQADLEIALRQMARVFPDRRRFAPAKRMP